MSTEDGDKGLRIDAASGSFSFDGVTAFAHDVRHAAFVAEGGEASAGARQARASNAVEYRLPETTFQGRRVLVSCSFVDDRIEGFHVELISPTGDVRSNHEEPEEIAAQEAWLKERVGCPSGEYPWGLVWNRYNIHTGYHDISIIYAR